MKVKLFSILILLVLALALPLNSIAQGRYCQRLDLDDPPLPQTMPFSFEFSIPPTLVFDRGFNVYYENSAVAGTDVSIVVIGDIFVLDSFYMSAVSGSHINDSITFPDGDTLYINFELGNAPPQTTIDVFEFEICSSFNYGGESGFQSEMMNIDSYPTPDNNLFEPFLYALGQFVFTIAILFVTQSISVIVG